MTTEITLANPRGNIETATKLCGFINERKRELLDEIAALEITADNYASPEVKAKLDAFADAVEDLRARGKKLVEAVCAATEAQRVLTQIDSRLWSFSTKADPMCAYALLSSALKAAKAKVAEFEAANEPPAPKHTYLVRLTCTDKVLDKVLKAAQKDGAEGVVWCAPQTDEAVKAAQRIFEENV